MKKNICFQFQEVFGLQTLKRLAFQDGGQTEALALKGVESNIQLDIKEGQKGLDKSLKGGEDAINKKAEEYKKRYEGKEDADKAKGAIEDARKKAVDALKARYETAKNDLKTNAVKASNEAADTLVKDRKEKAKSKYSDSHLENVSVGDSSIDTKLPDEKSFENEDMSDSAFKEAMVSMLRTVYIAEGEEAANKLSEKMKGMKKIGFTEMKNDPDFKLAQGVEHNPPLIQFDPDVTSGSYNSRVLAGKIYGLNHAADSLIKDDTAREEYKKYIADEGRKVGQAKDAAGIDAILTPAEWAKQHGAAEKMEVVDPEKLEKERLAKVNDHIANMPGSRGWQRVQLRGVLLGRLQSEPNPENWERIMNEVGAKACGLPVEEYKNTSWADLEKAGKIDGISDLVKTQADAMGKYALDEGKNRDGQTRGYIAGLMLAAEEKFKGNPTMLNKYKEELKSVTDSDDFKKKLGRNLEDSEYYSNRQRDMVWGKGPDRDSENRAELDKLGAANDAIFKTAKSSLITPDKFEAGLKEKAETKAEASPREAYVDGLLENIPAEKGKERDTLRGILMAAIGPKENKDGSVKTPEEMSKLIKPIMDTMGFSKDQGYETVNMEKLNKVLEGRNDFGDYGKKMDNTSKGYYAACIYQAEQQFKDNPKGLEAYKKHLKDAVNSDSFKSSTEDKMEKIKKYQDYLEDPVLSKRLTEEDKRTYREGIAKLTDEVFMETRRRTKWPEDFGKDFEKTKKEDLTKGNKEFLDKYGTSDKLDAPNAKKSLDGIFGSIPKEKVTEANKKDVEAKKKELEGKLAKAKDPEARLKVLAEAQDYSMDPRKLDAAKADDRLNGGRYQDAMESYTLTARILNNLGTNIVDKAKGTKQYEQYLKNLAAGIEGKGAEKISEDKKKNLDKALTKALRAAEDEPDDAKRGAIIAEQILEMNKAAGRPITFTKEDFDTYSAYINEKKEQAKAKAAKPGAPSGGGGPSAGGGPVVPGGGAPKGGPSAPGGAPKEALDTPEKILDAAKSTVTSVLLALINQSAEWKKMNVNSADDLAKKAKADAESRLAGVDLSKAKDQTIQLVGGNVIVTIQGGKATVDATKWAPNVYETKNKQLQEGEENRKKALSALAGVSGTSYDQIEAAASSALDALPAEQKAELKFKDRITTAQGVIISIGKGGGGLVAHIWGVTPELKEKNPKLYAALKSSDSDLRVPESGAETKESVEKEVAGYLNKWSAELKRWTNGGWTGQKTASDVRRAIIAHWTEDTEMPATLLAKIAKYPDIAPQYKPGAVFASAVTTFDNSTKKVTISAQYSASGKLGISGSKEEPNT